MERKFITYQHSTFSYLTGGDGKKILLCLHGFGEDAETFSFLEQYLKDEFTLFAIDLPWHGQTKWQKTHTFPVKGMIELLALIIPDFSNRSIHLLGYSMGGRVCLSLLDQIPAKISKAILLAPDGLKVNSLFKLATQTWLGNGLFKYTMRYPQWFGWMVDILKRFNRINPSVAKFVHYYIDDEKMRNDLYRIWTTMRKFRPKLPHIQKNIAHHRIPVHLVFGSYDRVILSKYGYTFQKGIEDCVTVAVLPTGHQLLREKQAAFIISLLTSPPELRS